MPRESSLLITHCRPYDAAEGAPLSSALIEDGRIIRIGPSEGPPGAQEVLDAQGCILSPGLIDVHIQGAGGADVLDARPEALQTISQTCARFGVTGFLATTVYKPGQDNRHLRIVAECIVDGSRLSHGALQPGEARASSHACSQDGTLIGTALGLNQMLSRLIQFTGCTVSTAIGTTTDNAAQVLGLCQMKGTIAPGKGADLVLFRPDLSVHSTIVAGRVVYRSQ